MKTTDSSAVFNIAAVERETGLSKDVLRVWERRYGFPTPTRDAHGERVYPAPQVERLRHIKRLMDQGHRPGKLMAASAAELAALTPRRVEKLAEPTPAAHLEGFLQLIKDHDSFGFLQALQQQLARQGLKAFVQDTIAPLTWQLGQAWEQGKVEVFEEHLYTELTKRLLRQAISSLNHGNGDHRPRILLTTVPEEEHLLGLLMAEALFTLEGAQCIPLGTETPLLDIARASAAHQAQVVALSFSVAFPPRQISPLLQQLRQLLPPATALWAGGSGLHRLTPPPGVQFLPNLEDGVAAVRGWQETGGKD